MRFRLRRLRLKVMRCKETREGANIKMKEKVIVDDAIANGAEMVV